MFDRSIPGPTEVAEVSDAALVAAIADWARASAAAEARKLVAIAELVRRRCTEEEHPDWACDDWDVTAAEVSCALTIGHGRALGQMDLALTLRDRLPLVGRRFLSGEISLRTVNTIVWRTALVRDEDALAQLDSALAERAADWGPLSQYKLEQAVDIWVGKVDPGAVRRTRNRTRDRYFTVGDRDDAAGATSVFGRLNTPDAAALEQRLSAMVKDVCDDDPRTMAQRRADAVGAMATGAAHLRCRCGSPKCSAAADDGRASSVVIHVIAEQQSLQESIDPMLDGEGLAAEGPAPQRRKAALIPGIRGGIVPAPMLAELIAHGAKVRFVGTPAICPEDRYRPSAALQEFIRTRDLTCRFPGCDRPAVFADIDHTVAWPVGSTHPGNLKCYCRIHHLVKTFWGGWSELQLADGTLLISTPSGHTYSTKPLSSLLFPAWNTATESPPPRGPAPSPAPGRGLMMPTRRVSRAKAREYRINAERALNAAAVAERAEPPPF
ncbi:hypothetical protein NGTWS1803_10450 [Mycolicibacterium cyprinidarum]|nr:hypothetical protein NGTWS1803_10450 [Mycolicibacterium sp. NGTWS1803]